MRKMHEEIVRDKGLYIIPATNIGNSTSLLPNGLLNSATSSKRPQGYKIPRKFTLESLGKMDYRDFAYNDYNDEFKPSDVVDSDEDIDEDIINLYHYKDRSSSLENVYRSVPNQVNSVVDVVKPKIKIDTNIAPHGPNRLKIVNSSMNKSLAAALPVPRTSKRNHEKLKVNRSMLPERKRSNIKVENRYGNDLVIKNPILKENKSTGKQAKSNSKSPKKVLSKAYGSKPYLKSSKNISSDYSPGRGKSSKIHKDNIRSLKRANEYDQRTKRKYESRLNNIIKLQDQKSLRVVNRKAHA